MKRRHLIGTSLLAVAIPMPGTAAPGADTSMFKAAVSAPAWQQAWQSVRQPLGAVRRRSTRSATYSRNLPGVPDGEYVVVQFDTAFENKAEAIETLTVALDRDGVWRVAGYFIR